MYNPDNRQYIFRDSTGKTIHLCLNERWGLVSNILTRRGTWSNTTVISQEAQQSFGVDMDSHDVLHILFQDQEGNLYYRKGYDKTGETIPVLKSKSPTPYDKYLNVLAHKNNLHFFYVLRRGDERLLSHQTMTDGQPGNPKVIDYVTKSSLPYTVLCDKAGNIYVFYQSSDGKHQQLGYKKYISLQNFWSDFTPVTRFNGDCEFPSVISDPGGILHICYQRRNVRQYELVYQQKMPDKNIWSPEVVLHASSYPFDTASIVYTAENLYVYWVREDTIYSCASNDGGNTWSKPARHMQNPSRQLICLVYKTNHPSEYDKFVARVVPGSVRNGLKLFFYQPAQEISDMSPEELRNLIVDSLKLLNEGVEELKQSEDRIREDITHLTASQQSLEKDLVKLSLKHGLLEGEINKIKQLGSKIDHLTESVKEITQRLESLSAHLCQPDREEPPTKECSESSESSGE